MKQNINFELYKVFCEVANEKSISKAAEKLLISQPAVTQSIKTLEDQLGGKLFIRTPKGVILTNEGEELYKYISIRLMLNILGNVLIYNDGYTFYNEKHKPYLNLHLN